MKKLLVLCICTLSAGLLAQDFDQPRAFLGVMTHANDGGGALVKRVVPDSAAEKAGVLAGDIIIDLNGTLVQGHRDLVEALSDFAPGDSVTLNITRDKDTMDLTVSLGESRTREWRVRSWVERPFIGIQMETLTDDLAEFFGVEHGVMIKRVVTDSPAEKAGLKAGDVITAIAGADITHARDIMTAIRDMKAGDTVDLNVQRREESLRLSVELGSGEDRPNRHRSFRSHK